MRLLYEAIAWLFTPGHWVGSSGIGMRIWEHLGIFLLALVLAAMLAIPLGLIIGHARRGSGIMGALTGAARSIPTLGLLTLFGLWFGIGMQAPLYALVILALPSLLAATYSGVHAIDPSIPLAARAIGMSPLQVLRSVEIPLALPTIVGGIRAASIQIVATATLAAYTADLGLGRFLFIGLKTRDYAQMLGAALLVTLIALLIEVLLGAAQRYATRKARPHSSTGKATP